MKDTAAPAIRAVRAPGTGNLVLDDIAGLLGAKTVDERAALWRIDWRTLYRLREGRSPSETTLAATLAALPEISARLRDVGATTTDLTFHDLFTVALERAA